VIVAAGGQSFVGPDNGLFSYIYAREPAARVFHATREEFFRHPVSPTFHGRDVFAPLAAWLSRGVSPEAVGEEIGDPLIFALPSPAACGDGRAIAGAVIHVDRFGNCVTNFTPRELDPSAARLSPRLTLGGRGVTRFVTHFAQAEEAGELFAYLGSAGYWEVGAWRASAAEQIGAGRGTQVILDFGFEI
jgi:S-adenosylmethionine hydrolase